MSGLQNLKSIFSEGIGNNNSILSGRHGGTEGAPESIPPSPPHDIEHSDYDNGAGINHSQISGRHYEGTIPFDQRPNTMGMDIMTPGERLGGVDVGRVQPVYTPISQILGDPEGVDDVDIIEEEK